MPSQKEHRDLKLIALDRDDLLIISAHLQDAIVRLADLAYLPGEKRFAAIMSRFDWIAAEESGAGGGGMSRRRCALRFDRVLRAQVQNLRLGDRNAVEELLAITYEEKEAPGGFVTLCFSGGGGIRLEVECIEAELRDIGASWRTAIRPRHAGVDEPSPRAGAAFLSGNE
jgi:hypothetical protein